jgi:hypothetical protein
MRVTSLHGRAPADYIHQKLPPYWHGHLQPCSLHSISTKVNFHVITNLNTIKRDLTVTLRTNTTAKLVPIMPTKCETAKVKLNKEPVSQTVPTATSIYFNFNFCASSNSPKSCITARSKTWVILIQKWAPSYDTWCSICINPTKTATDVLNTVTYIKVFWPTRYYNNKKL